MTGPTTIVAAAMLLLAPSALIAQQPTPKPMTPPASTAPKPKDKPELKEESKESLMKEAKVSEAAARATALKQVPGGVVKDHELEREDGKLIWSYDIKVAGKSGIEEIAIDAITGKMIAHEHETPRDEQQEAAEDAAKAKAKAAQMKKP